MNEELILEAKSCDGCLCWLRNCGAECCKGFFVTLKDTKDISVGSKLTLKSVLTEELKKYYKAHGVKVIRGGVVLVIDDFYIVNEHDLFVFKTCKYLTSNNLCSIHNDKKQFKICNDLNINNYHSINKKIRITPNCLFKYKLLGEEVVNGKT
jgi:hypothetical protein